MGFTLNECTNIQVFIKTDLGRREELKVCWSVFPAGEINVQLKLGRKIDLEGNVSESWISSKNTKSSDDIMKILLITDALRREFGNIKIQLFLPYLPYSRQDKYAKGEAFSLKVFGNILNSQGYFSVTTYDVHSPVAEACIDGLKVISPYAFIDNTRKSIIDRQEKGELSIPTCGISLVSPDAGASKKADFVASGMALHGVLHLVKSRNKEGVISNVSHYYDNLGTGAEGRTLLLVDDICDGGATFIQSVKAIRKAKYDNPIFLYVTHGLFTKGVKELKGYFMDIYCGFCYNEDVKVKNIFRDNNKEYDVLCVQN